MRPEYAPPGGETLLDVADRVAAALKAIDRSRRTLVVAHGGSIAVARCLCAGLPLDKAAPLIPRPGEIVSLNV
jgi:broad specificity phosphatase PhoE